MQMLATLSLCNRTNVLNAAFFFFVSCFFLVSAPHTLLEDSKRDVRRTCEDAKEPQRHGKALHKQLGSSWQPRSQGLSSLYLKGHEGRKALVQGDHLSG